MKFTLLISFIQIMSLSGAAQTNIADQIAHVLTDDQILAPLRYLASDRLRGRSIGSPEIDTAAAYIAAEFRHAGAMPVPGANGYYQAFVHSFNPMQRTHMERQVASNIPFSTRHGVTIKNVLAFVMGTDPVLRKQFILLSAHYDHVGVAESAIMEEGKMDSIFNGAGDNAAGTAAVIAAARYFARWPPKRSVLFICYSAEEEGEIGSRYYCRIVNDTMRAAIVGYLRNIAAGNIFRPVLWHCLRLSGNVSPHRNRAVFLVHRSQAFSSNVSSMLTPMSCIRL